MTWKRTLASTVILSHLVTTTPALATENEDREEPVGEAMEQVQGAAPTPATENEDREKQLTLAMEDLRRDLNNLRAQNRASATFGGFAAVFAGTSLLVGSIVVRGNLEDDIDAARAAGRLLDVPVDVGEQERRQLYVTAAGALGVMSIVMGILSLRSANDVETDPQRPADVDRRGGTGELEADTARS